MNLSSSYTPVRRRTGGPEPLTPEQARYILANPYDTGYTYALSSSYSANNPRDYTHPNIGRRPVLSNYSGSSFSSSNGSYQSSSDNNNVVFQIFYFFYYIFSTVISWVKYTIWWIGSTLLQTLLMMTPLGPLYLGYQKGSDILSYIPIVGQFLKKVVIITYRCLEDLVYKNGYILNEIKNDARDAFWNLFGYKYDSNVRIEEIEDHDESGSVHSIRTVKSNESSSSIVRRAIDSAIYAATLGYYPKGLNAKGVVPPSRTTHRTRHTGKSRIVSFFLNLAGMVYYIVSGQFLFENLHSEEEHRVLTRRQKENLAEEKRRFNWLWLLGLLALFLALWWLFAPPLGAKADDDASYPVKLAHGIGSGIDNIGRSAWSLTHWAGSKFVSGLLWIPAILSRSASAVKDYAHTSTDFASKAAISQEADDVRTAAVKDTEMRQIESIINIMFEKERETIRLEKEQLNKVIEECASGKSEQSLPLTQEEITKLVQNSINKLNLSALVDEVVKYHVKSQLSETEHRSTHSYDEFVENKLRVTIFEALRKFSYDKTGEPDFALESAGGHVLSTRCTENYDQHSRRESIFGIPLWYTSYSPRSVIQRQSQNVNAGECWAIKGSKAYLVIKLARKLDVTAISYEHLPRELSITGNMESAPKNFKIWSLDTENDANKFLLGEYVFNDQGEPLQRFEAQRHDPRGTPIIELKVTSNYGAAFTCLYRFRVHGNPLD